MAQPTFSGAPPLAVLTGVASSGLTATTNGLNIYPARTVNGVDPIYNFDHLKYPQEISYTSYQGHYINFFINAHKSSTYLESGGYSTKRAVPGQSYYGSGTFDNYQTTNKPTIPSSTIGAIVNTWTYQRITQAISLYIPDTMSTTQNIQWENASLWKSGAKLIRGAGDKAGGKVGGNMLKRFGLNAIRSLSSLLEGIGDFAGAAGYAINPQLLVIFRTVDPRSFTYEFYFSPKNEAEAQAVYDIIYTFRFHAAPEAHVGPGVFFIAPSTFDIEFMHKGRRNVWLHQIKTCVLKQYNVDYAPHGWSTLIDGMPVVTRLVLYFQEVDIICKEDVQYGW